MVKLHYADLDLSAPEYAIWESLKTRIWELSSFLVDHLKMVDVGACFNYRVGYHASCHLSRDLDVKSQPLELLRHVEGLELIEDRWEAECCGFGGVFSAKYPELSRAMADRRAGQLTEGEAQYITGADDSCLQHISQAFKRAGSMVKTIHIARILASERSQK
jgi:L-lactate dehydrogenase complex protein LldE